MADDIQPGHVGWVDLTVENATEVRDFYRAVVGWEYREVDMDGYADFAMTNLEGRDVTGICHARGVNEGLPAQWMGERSPVEGGRFVGIDNINFAARTLPSAAQPARRRMKLRTSIF